MAVGISSWTDWQRPHREVPWHEGPRAVFFFNKGTYIQCGANKLKFGVYV